MSTNSTFISATIEFNCGNCHSTQLAEVNSMDFSSDNSPCELCGSHGELTIDVKCPECQSFSEIIIKEW